MNGSVEQIARLALDLPGVVQGQHFDIPDFRVRGRVFCTARTGECLAMVKLPQEIQTAVMNGCPEAITPAAGAWGRRGATLVRTDLVSAALLADLIVSAWRHAAPKPLVAAYLADLEKPG
jgi:hypothetical protein